MIHRAQSSKQPNTPCFQSPPIAKVWFFSYVLKWRWVIVCVTVIKICQTHAQAWHCTGSYFFVYFVSNNCFWIGATADRKCVFPAFTPSKQHIFIYTRLRMKVISRQQCIHLKYTHQRIVPYTGMNILKYNRSRDMHGSLANLWIHFVVRSPYTKRFIFRILSSYRSLSSFPCFCLVCILYM